MIYGRLIDGKAIVPVIFSLPTQPDFSIDFIIDTGFNDHLTLPTGSTLKLTQLLYLINIESAVTLPKTLLFFFTGNNS